eukprot:GFUD01111250.1.p1 GENE.GFUD01111250.1~~GFUD01111250.1.p1  ORF type:complete len:185 (+),score=60.89 GFUD01111250.1:39-593(+)
MAQIEDGENITKVEIYEKSWVPPVLELRGVVQISECLTIYEGMNTSERDSVSLEDKKDDVNIIRVDCREHFNLTKLGKKMVEEKKKGRKISIKNGDRKISIKNGKYYHEESGVYIGPAHNFDDEGLEDEDESFEKIIPSPPIVNCLSIDSMAGIFIGFPEKVKNEVQRNETRDINDIQVLDGGG